MNSNENLIYNTAIDAGLPINMALLLIAQAKHETGNFTSKFFINYNNAFGYSYVNGAKWQKGPGPKADNGSPIAVYDSIKNSVMEIIDWIKRRQNEGKFPKDLTIISSPENYAQLLKNSGYYGDTVFNYGMGLKRWFDENMKPVAFNIGSMVVIGLAMYILSEKK